MLLVAGHLRPLPLAHLAHEDRLGAPVRLADVASDSATGVGQRRRASAMMLQLLRVHVRQRRPSGACPRGRRRRPSSRRRRRRSRAGPRSRAWSRSRARRRGAARPRRGSAARGRRGAGRCRAARCRRRGRRGGQSSSASATSAGRERAARPGLHEGDRAEGAAARAERRPRSRCAGRARARARGARGRGSSPPRTSSVIGGSTAVSPDAMTCRMPCLRPGPLGQRRVSSHTSLLDRRVAVGHRERGARARRRPRACRPGTGRRAWARRSATASAGSCAGRARRRASEVASVRNSARASAASARARAARSSSISRAELLLPRRPRRSPRATTASTPASSPASSHGMERDEPAAWPRPVARRGLAGGLERHRLAPVHRADDLADELVVGLARPRRWCGRRAPRPASPLICAEAAR